MSAFLIADSGATKCEWSLGSNKTKRIITTGISPYFLSEQQIVEILNKELLPGIKEKPIEKIFFYGTGLSNPNNKKILKSALKKAFPKAEIFLETDLLGAARAACGNEKGMVAILGTGSNSCFYNGKKITKNSPGLGYVLGDEGSGAYLGKKVIQYYLYNTFDEDLKSRFDARFVTNPVEILENVYKKPLPNRYLASFTVFLSENRNHYMIENILEDGLNDFFYHHLFKYAEVWTHPLHFVGGIAYQFRDVLQQICRNNQLEPGKFINTPMNELVRFHQNN